MSELDAVGKGDAPAPYMLFVVVFLFFITGLLGFLVCHMLKKKGYHCRTGDLDDEEDEEEELKANAGDEEEDNQDTVDQILKCIIENEANIEALNEMLGNQNICVHHDPRVRKESLAGIPPHHHTVHSGGNINSCHLCAQVRSKKSRRQSKTPRFKQRPGEQTVLSVGRFRVTHTDKKLHGGSNSLAESGNQLDQSPDNDDRKEAGYNLRSMFKDAQPFSQASNGPAQNAGKRRRSLTIFGLRRGSDGAGTRLNDGASKELGLGKFGVHQQPVVLEEPLPKESCERSRTPPPPEVSGSTTSDGVNNAATPSSPPGNEPEEEPTVDPPKSLMIPLTAESQKILTATNTGDVVYDKMEDMCDPGPQQTSTPIVLEPGLLETAPGFDANLTLACSSPPPSPQNNLATSPVSAALTTVTSSRNSHSDEKQTDFL
ncbi:RELT-like protein 2 [Synchiropus splendidus]|uniref:RELT-like protein 2 n=1 Tax=Synchiropus splendidus TaxID=270530 RepID=UPI00237E9FC1|nr:RELT-like protein 2 [Synchiropus splendidus]XP_053735699.1 RELT-like protein 2 [Synchiropus splendidus]